MVKEPCGPGIRPTKVGVEKREGYTKWESEEQANIIMEATGILDHGQESPHGLLDVSYLTSGT